jgi:hypothetical protein
VELEYLAGLEPAAPSTVTMSELVSTILLVALCLVACTREPEKPAVSNTEVAGVRAAGEQTPPQAVSGGWLEAIGERVLPLIEKHDTEFAPRYREEVFRKIPLGIAEAEVTRLLGPPLQTKQFFDGTTCWYYTRHGERFASYFVRILEFDQKGILIARRHYFYAG